MILGNSEIENLDSEISKMLRMYVGDLADKVKEITEEVSKTMLEEIRAAAPKRTGRYRRAMTLTTLEETTFSYEKVWHVKSPHYRLTHLLEYGHVKRGGKGRVRAYPHIGKAAEKAEEAYIKKIERAITE